MMDRYIDIGGRSFAGPFWRRDGVSFTHTLNEHPLLKIPAIADLADRLAKDSVVCDQAVKPLLVPGGGPERGVQPRPGDLIRDLEHSGSWLTLLNVEQDHAYRELVDDCVACIAPYVDRFRGDVRRPSGFIFVSSPDSVTPAHFDIEHSFPMQVQGSRTLTLGNFTTPDDEEHEVGRYWGGSHGRIESLPEESKSFALEPARGVYIPPLVPHWITNGPTPSVSMTLTLFTRDTDEDSLIRVFNHKLRALPGRRTPPGHSLSLDASKVAAMRLYGLRRHLGRGDGGDASESHAY
jgi:hypothetical protein